MIRASDLPSTAVWTQTVATAPRVPFDSRARDASNWFRGDAPTSAAKISGDVSAAARGLSVDQHAAAVLAHLRADSDAVR
jgi:hypothetical protein